MTKYRYRFSTRNEEVDITSPHACKQDAQGLLIYPEEELTSFIYYPWHLVTSPIRFDASKEDTDD